MTRTRALGLSIIIIAAGALILAAAGRVWISTSGQILWWVSDLSSPEASQQFSDWYSASHFIHGILFFGLLYVLRRYLSLGTRLVIAVVVEVGWEILENSPLIIDRYREGTIAIGYMGDSILNSVSDIFFMMFGFVFASLVSWRISLIVIIILELGVFYMINDNLFLNILMLVYPIDAVRLWQGG